MKLISELQDTAPDSWEFENEIGNGERYRFALEFNCVFCHISSQSGGRWKVVVNHHPDSTEDPVFQKIEDEWQSSLSLASAVMALYTAAVEDTIDSLNSFALSPDDAEGMPGADTTANERSQDIS